MWIRDLKRILKTTNFNMENVTSDESVSLNQTGTWNFSRKFDFNSDYEVKLEKQPLGWTCTLSNAGPAKMPASDHNNVVVECKLSMYDAKKRSTDKTVKRGPKIKPGFASCSGMFIFV